MASSSILNRCLCNPAEALKRVLKPDDCESNSDGQERDSDVEESQCDVEENKCDR